MKRFFLVFAIASVISAILVLNIKLSFIFVLVAFILLLVAVAIHLKLKLPYTALAVTVIASIILMCCYTSFSINKMVKPTRIFINKEITFKAIVAEEPSEYDEYGRVIVRAIENDGDIDGLRFLVYYNEDTNLKYNDIISLKMHVRELTYTSFYADKVFLTGFADELDIIKNKGENLYSKAISLRNYINTVFIGKINDDVVGIPIGMLTGNRNFISDEFNSNVKSVGMTHVMAVSGLHISIICLSIVNFIRKKFKLNNCIPSIIGIFIVIIMAAVAGFTGSILRAGIMCLSVFIGNLFFRKSDPLNSLGLAITILLLVNPYNIYSVSLILSALGTYGILVFSSGLTEMLKEIYPFETFLRKPYEYLSNAMSVTLSANLFIIPMSIITFGYISTISPIVNLILSPIVYLCLLFSLLAVITSFIPFVNELLLFVVEILSYCFKIVVDYFSGFTFNSFYADDIMLYLFLVVLIVVIILIFIIGKSKVMTLILASVLCVILPIFSVVQGNINSNKLNYYFPSTTNGSAMAIESNEHFILVISTTDNNAFRQIKSKLDSRFSPKIDILIIPSDNYRVYNKAIEQFKDYEIDEFLLSNNKYMPDAKTLEIGYVNIWDTIKLKPNKLANGYNLYFYTNKNCVIFDNFCASANKGDYIVTSNLNTSYKINGNNPRYIVLGEHAKNSFTKVALNSLGAKAALVKDDIIFAAQNVNKELNFFQ